MDQDLLDTIIAIYPEWFKVRNSYDIKDVNLFRHGIRVGVNIVPNPVITTSVYTIPRQLRQIFCGTN